MASISSIKIIALHTALALPKSSLTFAAHIPTNISINSEPEAEKKGTFDSHATALANSVLPDHGCP
jgi:hypothetical protein